MNVRAWLRRVPQPSAVRCDGKKNILVGQGKNRWRDCIFAIEALQPATLEALDEKGDVIRVCQLGDEGDAPAADAAKPAAGALSEQAQLANIILEATDRGAQRHAAAYELAFGKMTDLVQMLAERMTALEGAWQKTLEQRAADLSSGASGDGLEAGIAGLLASAVANQATVTPDKANGQKRKD